MLPVDVGKIITVVVDPRYEVVPATNAGACRGGTSGAELHHFLFEPL